MDLIKMYISIEIAFVVLLLVFGALFVFLGVTRRDFEIIQRRPILFLIELIVVSVLPALPFLFFAVSRGLEMGTALTWFYSIAIKFALFHILFQVSGIYTFLFSSQV